MRALTALYDGLDTGTVVAVFGGLGLLTLYAYQGQAEFFSTKLAPDLGLGVWGPWAAESWQFGAAFVLMGLVPLLWFRLGQGRPLSELGLCLGDWRFGLRFVAIGALALTIPLWISAGSPAFQAEYPLAKIATRSWGLFVAWECCYAVYYLGWEALFRGFWQLGQRRHLGLFGALALQAAASTILHIGKPEGEFAAAVVAGLVFGLVAVRTRSILYVFLLHWYVGAMTDLFCALRAGAPC
ncbi:MAG: CPBP family intramembrane glutamic endopeptidase [Pseudomonadota bacterium]